MWNSLIIRRLEMNIISPSCLANPTSSRSTSEQDPSEAMLLSVEEFEKYTTKRTPTLSLPYPLPIDELSAPIPTINEIAKYRQTENDLTLKRPLYRY
jgi:hypothetical protein